VEIDCFKNLRLCVAATAEFYMGHAHVSVQYLDIIKWDRNGIVAQDSSPVCLANTFLINFADHSITLNATLKELDDKTKSACAAFVAAKSESSIFVVKGTDRWEKEHSLFPQK
jgi:hypothetical protein